MLLNLLAPDFKITNSVICDLCQMKLNREELANTSFDQINFNEWRLWFFKGGTINTNIFTPKLFLFDSQKV